MKTTLMFQPIMSNIIQIFLYIYLGFMSSSLYIVDKCSCGALCKSRLIFISFLNIIQEPASKKVSLAEPTFTIPAAAEKVQKPIFLENLQISGSTMRRGSLAKPKKLEEVISENAFLGSSSRRGSLAQTKILENAILEMETLGPGSRRGSLADIIPDWPTLKPFEKVAKSKVLKVQHLQLKLVVPLGT